MPFVSETRRYLPIFYRQAGSRLPILVILTLLGSLIEGIGLTLIFPLLASTNLSGASNDHLSRMIAAIFAAAGLAPTLATTLWLMVLVFGLKGLAEYARTAYQSALMASVARDIRWHAVRIVRQVEYQHFADHNVGQTTNMLTVEVPRAVGAMSSFVAVLSGIFTLLGLAVVSVLVDPRFTLLAGVIGVAVGFSLSTLTRRVRRNSFEITRLNGLFSSILLQALSSFKYLTATAAFPRLQRQLERLLEQLYLVQKDSGFLGAARIAVLEPIIVSALAGTIYVESHLFGRPLASILVSLVIFYRILTVIMGLQNTWHGFHSKAGAVDVVSESLRRFSLRRESSGQDDCPPMQHGIHVKDLGFSYGGPWRLVGVSMRIPKNSCVAVLGASGTGKSTIVDLLTGILRPTSGEILLDGKPLSLYSMESWRRRIGYVTQECVLYDDTVAKNISLWAEEESGADRGKIRARVREAARRAIAADFIERLPGGYEAPIGDRGTKLSGGQRQRLAIARELFKAPDLLILDEATSALDGPSERLVQESIDSLRGYVTVVIISHRLHTVRSADYVYLLDEGQTVEEGPVSDLLRDPRSRLFHLYGQQMDPAQGNS